MNYLGIDPDTSHMGIALLCGDRLHFFCARAKGKSATDRMVPMASALDGELLSVNHLVNSEDHSDLHVAIEWPLPRPGDPNPKNIAELMACAGMAVQGSEFLKATKTYLPLPSDWKGQVPKHEKHNRIVREVGYQTVHIALNLAGIPCPGDLGSFKKEFTGLASHLLDALGLALWARERARLQALVRRSKLPSS